MAYLGDKSVGSIVKIKENGTAVNYIIVHKGKPSSLYDDSCDGVWVLRQNIHSEQAWNSDSDVQGYDNSTIHLWLNSTFLTAIDKKISSEIISVRIPYTGVSSSMVTLKSGSAGLACRVFLLSGYEVGFTTSGMKADGAKLDYFDANSKRTLSSAWWLRTLCDTSRAYTVSTSGSSSAVSDGYSKGVRPAFILPATLCVTSDGLVTTNNPPTITADKTGDLGTLDSGFTCNYSVDDVDEGDSVSVTLDLDGVQIDTFTATKNQQYTYTLGGNEWLKTTNGSHTFSITASDGKGTATNTITFTRNLTELTVTLEAPFPADDRITACALTVDGSIPADAVCKFEVTNNALDDEPVWEDCTTKSKAGFSYIFNNKTAENGFAFNFRVTISRGASGSGGYITSISGGFE